jgi:hypothetical protein
VILPPLIFPALGLRGLSISNKEKKFYDMDTWLGEEGALRLKKKWRECLKDLQCHLNKQEGCVILLSLLLILYK